MKSTRIALAAALAVSLLAVPAAAADGWLGIQMQDISGSMAKALQLTESGGVLVSEVIADSPAAAAGLEDGDVIVAVDGAEIQAAKDLTKAIRKTDPGETVTLTVLRGGRERDLEVTLGERDQDVAFFAPDDNNTWHVAPDAEDLEDVFVWRNDDGETTIIAPRMGLHAGGGYLGVGLQDLGEQLGDHFGVPGGDGALVTEVKEDSPAAAAGLGAGDVVVDFGGTDIDDTDDLTRAAARAEPGDEVDLTFVRDRVKQTVTVTVGERPEFKHLESRHFMPRMMREYGGDLHEKMADAQREVHRALREQHYEVQRQQEETEDVEALRQELDQLREELQQMKQELDERRR